eukprot:m.317844 g.317844  ORF g.317844 m.317844 type:complete len:1135 (+) comp16442_c0_seq2:26-3430(+)
MAGWVVGWALLLLTAGPILGYRRIDAPQASPSLDLPVEVSGTPSCQQIIAQCNATVNCARCLSAVGTAVRNAPIPPGETRFVLGLRSINHALLRSLMNTPECHSTENATIIRNALNAVTGYSSCSVPFGAQFSECVEKGAYGCALNSSCRSCVNQLLDPNIEHSVAFRSPDCVASTGFLANMTISCQLAQCSWAKTQCELSTECTDCWNKLRVGDAVGAAKECPSGSVSSELVAQYSEACAAGTHTACVYTQFACQQVRECRECLNIMGPEVSPFDLAVHWQGAACQQAREPSSRNGKYSVSAIVRGCTSMYSNCQIFVAGFLGEFPSNASCLTGNASVRNSVGCLAALTTMGLKPTNESSVSGQVCNPARCEETLTEVNRLVWITTTIGGISVFACLLVAAAIVAYGHDRVALRDRIVIKLALANAVYSSANVVPMNLVSTDPATCGYHILPPAGIQIGRAVWFCGKYALVGWELMILVTSIHALCTNHRRLRVATEVTLHSLCVLLGAAAFSTFYVLSDGIIRGGYNNTMLSEARAGYYMSIGLIPQDDADDDASKPVGLPATALATYDKGRANYDELVRVMLLVWDALLGIAILLWVSLRIMYRRTILQWRRQAAAVINAANRDAWRDTRQSAWRADHASLASVRETYTAVAEPLELYVAVFVVFAVPAVLMSTEFCQQRSSASEKRQKYTGFMTWAPVQYGTCDTWCELVLSLRSLATVAVYLRHRQRRKEFADVPKLWWLLRCRLIRSDEVHHRDGTLNKDSGHEKQRSTTDTSHKANHSSAMSDWWMSESDVTISRLIGNGSYGAVWEGRLLDQPSNPVAIKILHSVLDDSGQRLNLHAETDLAIECESLRQVSHPNLLRFYGFGMTADGKGFIVTELMAGGSLRRVLQDEPMVELPWRLRLSIATQVATGMAHLHSIPIVHRDLKSDNVLLDEGGRVVVGDFGTSRRLRPQPSLVVVSAFTGQQHVRPHVEGGEQTADGGGAPPSSAPGNGDVYATMTNAYGSLPWMAPEMFRGDRHFGWQVDVYSFGMLLWELACRTRPWEDEFRAIGEFNSLVEHLKQALQTGRRPRIPDDIVATHEDFVCVMRDCWAGDPADRPSFEHLIPRLAACLRRACSRTCHSASFESLE